MCPHYKTNFLSTSRDIYVADTFPSNTILTKIFFVSLKREANPVLNIKNIIFVREKKCVFIMTPFFSFSTQIIPFFARPLLVDTLSHYTKKFLAKILCFGEANPGPTKTI